MCAHPLAADTNAISFCLNTQARAAELLRQHTELRAALFGSHALLNACRGEVPASVPLDAAKLLRLWDYERSLGPQAWHVYATSMNVRIYAYNMNACV